MPEFLRVRLRGTEVWVGKLHTTYALASCIDSSEERVRPAAHWWADEAHAKVWTLQTSLKGTVMRVRRTGLETMSRLEVVFADGSAKPLDELIPPTLKRVVKNEARRRARR